MLADGFARNGYRTVIPDLFQGDARPADTIGSADFDRKAWVARHGPHSWIPVVEATVTALQAEGVTWIGTTGYCFGAPPAWHFALNGIAKVTVVSHPSRLRVPGDLEVCAFHWPCA